MQEVFTYRELRLQDTKTDKIDPSARHTIRNGLVWQKKVIETSNKHMTGHRRRYLQEQAPVVLPEGLTKTRLYMNGTLRPYTLHELRGENGTQKEHMEIVLNVPAISSFPVKPR